MTVDIQLTQACFEYWTQTESSFLWTPTLKKTRRKYAIAHTSKAIVYEDDKVEDTAQKLVNGLRELIQSNLIPNANLVILYPYKKYHELANVKILRRIQKDYNLPFQAVRIGYSKFVAKRRTIEGETAELSVVCAYDKGTKRAVVDSIDPLSRQFSIKCLVYDQVKEAGGRAT